MELGEPQIMAEQPRAWLTTLAKGLIAEVFPAAAGVGGMRAAEHPFGRGEQAEDYGGLFIGQASLDDEAAELDLMPGIGPAIGISDAPHPNQVPPHHRARAAQQLCGFCPRRNDAPAARHLARRSSPVLERLP